MDLLFYIMMFFIKEVTNFHHDAHYYEFQIK